MYNTRYNIEDKLDKIIWRLHKMSVEFDNLVAQVHANSSALDSAIVVINSIADRITAAGTDPVQLVALTTELRGKDDELATAIVNVPPVTTPPVVTPTP